MIFFNDNDVIIFSFTHCLKIGINIYYIMLRVVSKLIIKCSAKIVSWFGEIGARFGSVLGVCLNKNYGMKEENHGTILRITLVLYCVLTWNRGTMVENQGKIFLQSEHYIRLHSSCFELSLKRCCEWDNRSNCVGKVWVIVYIRNS